MDAYTLLNILKNNKYWYTVYGLRATHNNNSYKFELYDQSIIVW